MLMIVIAGSLLVQTGKTWGPFSFWQDLEG